MMPATNVAIQSNGTQKIHQTNIFKKTTMEVLTSTNYGLFKLMPNNRNVNLLHIKRLKESMEVKQLVCPIIVNKNHEIIDGQHRFMACKELGLPVYYIVVASYGITEVQMLNSNQKNWNNKDYLESYCQEGVKPYLQFKQFMIDFPELDFLSCKRILSGLASSAGEKTAKNTDFGSYRMKEFENGKFHIPDLNKSYSAARKIMDLKPYYNGFNKGIFSSVMLGLLKNKNYKHKEMLHKLSVCPIKMQDCLNIEAYKMLMEDIYNHKRQKENKVSFRYS